MIGLTGHKIIRNCVEFCNFCNLNDFPLKTLKLGWVAFHSVTFQLKYLDFQSNKYKKLVPVLSCFCNRLCFPRKVFLRRRSGLFCFAFPMSFCAPECHQKVMKSSTAEKLFLFSFPCSPLREKQTKDRSSRQPKELLKFVRYIPG